MPRDKGEACAQAIESCQAELDTRFTTLLRDQREPLCRFVLERVGKAADAEDIAQQTFVQAYRDPRLHGESDPSTWLYGIAASLVRNHHLGHPPASAHEDRPDGTPLADGAAGTNRLIQHMELMTSLYRQIEQLPNDLQCTFLLAALEGRTCEDIARKLNIPVDTVRSDLVRARKILGARLSVLQDSPAL